MRLRVPEIDEDTVAHVLGHEAVKPGDRLCDTFVVGSDRRSQILGIELCRERGRADEVGEHDGQLPVLGAIALSRLSGGHRRGRMVAEFADRSQQLAAVSQGHAQFLQILIGQFGENIEIDVVIGKTLGVLS
jgi:hypothetical protein